MLGEELEMEEEFSDEADDGRGLSTEQVSVAKKLHSCVQLRVPAGTFLVSVQVTQLMDMLCNETDVAELDVEVGHPQLMASCCLAIQSKKTCHRSLTYYVHRTAPQIIFICHLVYDCRWGASHFMSDAVLMLQHLPALSQL